LFIGVNEFTHGLKPLVVGLLIVSIGLSLGGTTGFAMNPARDLVHALLMHFYQFMEKELRIGVMRGFRWLAP
jgi:glycerol uptake facilitator protein